MARKATSYEILQNRPFVLYQVSRLFVTLALQMLSVAVGWQVYSMTGRAMDLGLVGLFTFIPFFLVCPLGGDLADRYSRSKIIRFTQVGLFGVAVTLLAVAYHGLSVHWIFVSVAIMGAVRALLAPAGSAVLPLIVPKEQFEAAVAWSASVWQLATAIGPAIGGLCYAYVDAEGVYLISAFLFVIGFFSFLFVSVPFTKSVVTETFLKRVNHGLSYVRRHPILLGAISLDLFAVLLGGAVGLLPVFAKDILQVGPFGLGVLRSAPAVGAVGTALLLAHYPLQTGIGKKLFVSVTVFGVATIVFGISTSFWLSLVALVIVGASDMVSVVIRNTLVQIKTPNELRGRVSAVNLIFIGVSNELGEFESGFTAEWMGPVIAVVVGGVGSCLVALIWALKFPELRKSESLSD